MSTVGWRREESPSNDGQTIFTAAQAKSGKRSFGATHLAFRDVTQARRTAGRLDGALMPGCPDGGDRIFRMLYDRSSAGK
jgi:hypothetical protein